MINFNLPEKKMEELRVAGIYLFGSEAQGVSGPTSDFDFGVLMENPKILSDAEARKKIYNELYDIFSNQIKQLKNIDIVFLQDGYLQLQYHAVSQGKLIYVKNPQFVGNYKERVIEHHADFAPLRREFHKAILQRI